LVGLDVRLLGRGAGLRRIEKLLDKRS